MKRIFFKVLPFAAALLLATSCSKDDNTSVNDEVIDNSQQIETVVKTFKTLTVKGKVNKSISKVTVNDNALSFEGTEVFAFGNESADVYGTITFSGTDGSYTATINYTDESKLLTERFSASLGTNPATISAAYENLAAAVKNAYYTIDFSITHNGGEYKLKSDNSTDIVVNLQSAFIKALAGNTEKLDGTSITVEAGKYYVVPVGKTMGETQNTTVAGKIYSLGSTVPEGYVDLGVTVGTQHIYFEKSDTYAHGAWQDNQEDWPTVDEWSALVSQCYCVWSASPKGLYVFKAKEGFVSQNGTPATDFGSYSKESDTYIFLPVTVSGGGYYWSSESDGDFFAFCLHFNPGYVIQRVSYLKTNVTTGVVKVRRSN